MPAQGDVRGDFIHLEGRDIGKRAVAAVDGALVKGARHFREGHGLAADAARLGEGDVQRDVRHAHPQAVQVFHPFNGLLGVEVAEAEREGVEHAQAGLFDKAVGDELQRVAVHGATSVVKAVVQHGGFKHGHGRMQGGSLRAGGAHLDDAAPGVGDVGVFLAKLAVGENLHLELAVGKFIQVFAKIAHPDGFGFAFGFHARDFDDHLVSRGRACQPDPQHEPENAEGRNQLFHQKISLLTNHIAASLPTPA